MRYKKCHTGQMFVAKGKQPFTFYISGRGMAPHNMSMSDIKVYLQGLLSHADKNIMDKLYRDMKPRGLIFDMITSVEDYDRL